jgi:hypothetical protein
MRYPGRTSRLSQQLEPRTSRFFLQYQLVYSSSQVLIRSDRGDRAALPWLTLYLAMALIAKHGRFANEQFNGPSPLCSFFSGQFCGKTVVEFAYDFL